MVQADVDIRPVIAAYSADCHPENATHLGNAGGFSGSRIWRLETPRGPLCLRRWPLELRDASRLHYIHQTLERVSSSGFHKVPLPIRHRHGTFCDYGGYFWELTEWMAGQADYHLRPSRARLGSAMQELARFHLAAGARAGWQQQGQWGPAPAVQRRLEFIDELARGQAVAMQHIIKRGPRPSDVSAPGLAHRQELFDYGDRLLHLFARCSTMLRSSLARWHDRSFRLQPCIRDIWHDHVFFVGENVSGFVDFGAMNRDVVLTDVARLLGSLVEDDQDAWMFGVKAYAQVLSLPDEHQSLIRVLDQTNLVLSGMNWLKWVLLEQRCFADEEAVLARLASIAERATRWSLSQSG